MRNSQNLPIGFLAERTGLSVSAIRFYEEKGLITPGRNAGGQRRYHRADIRRLSFVMISQQLGFSLAEIQTLLDGLPKNRTPTKADWTRIGNTFRQDIDQRIAALSLLRDRLDGCIGCGCLSLKACSLYNPRDVVGQDGPGARLVSPSST